MWLFEAKKGWCWHQQLPAIDLRSASKISVEEKFTQHACCK